jgi:uncharacterized protein (TIGR03067 family)
MNRCIVLTLSAFVLVSRAARADDGARKDAETFQGTWKMVYSETGGKGFEPTNEILIRFEKDTFADYAGGEIACRGTFKLDPSRKPKHLDSIITENKLIPESKGTKICCIYELSDDRLKIRYPDPGFSNWRPREFTTYEKTTGNLLRDIARGGRLAIYKEVKP